MTDWQNAIGRARSCPVPVPRAGPPDIEALLAAGRIEDAIAAATAMGEGIDDTAVALRANGWRWRWRWRSAILPAPCRWRAWWASFPPSPTARWTPPSPPRSGAARPMPSRAVFRDRAGQARRGRTQLFVRHRSHPALRSAHPAPTRSRRTGRSRAARGARGRRALHRERRRLCVPDRPAPAPGVGSQPAGPALRSGDHAYRSSALAWERAAFIRARAAARDVAAGRAFLDTIRPFVWRRSLDFGAIAEIGRLTTRIRDHYAGGQAIGPGYDLKRGRGGIREVEFFAQTHS
jgi:glutamate-ammonia-ligase adenylyltransferase